MNPLWFQIPAGILSGYIMFQLGTFSYPTIPFAPALLLGMLFGILGFFMGFTLFMSDSGDVNGH